MSGQSTSQETKLIVSNVEKAIQKAPLKADLIVQLKKLEKEHESLKIENENNIKTINKLEIRVAELEEECKQNVAAGEGDDELDLSFGPRFCKKCDFEAEDGYQLDGHFYSEHDDSDVDLLPCQHCDNRFASMKDLMIHKKIEHVDNVSKCWHFMNGFCPFGDERCWFGHENETKEIDGQEHKEIKCNICGEMLNSKTNFMKHRKIEHESSLKSCKLYEKGNCTYNENCWFSHKTTKSGNMTKKFEKDENKA